MPGRANQRPPSLTYKPTSTPLPVVTFLENEYPARFGRRHRGNRRRLRGATTRRAGLGHDHSLRRLESVGETADPSADFGQVQPTVTAGTMLPAQRRYRVGADRTRAVVVRNGVRACLRGHVHTVEHHGNRNGDRLRQLHVPHLGRCHVRLTTEKGLFQDRCFRPDTPG